MEFKICLVAEIPKKSKEMPGLAEYSPINVKIKSKEDIEKERTIKQEMEEKVC